MPLTFSQTPRLSARQLVAHTPTARVLSLLLGAVAIASVSQSAIAAQPQSAIEPQSAIAAQSLPHPRMPQVKMPNGPRGSSPQTREAMPAKAALPKAIANQILQDMHKRSGIPVSQLRITRSEGTYWDGCLGVAEPGTPCTMQAIAGWRVTVAGPQTRWVYHATQGQGIKLNGVVSVPRALVNSAIQDAAQRSNLPKSQFKLHWAEQVRWSDGCLGLGGDQMCTQALVPGWRLVVSHGDSRWVYRSALQGTSVVFDAAASTPGKVSRQLPPELKAFILNDISVRLGRPNHGLKIVQADFRTWNPCENLPPDRVCAQVMFSGWRVLAQGLVNGQLEEWVYQGNTPDRVSLSNIRLLRQG